MTMPVPMPVATLTRHRARASGWPAVCSPRAAASASFAARIETPGRVSYTQITTRYDEVVTPYLSAYLAPGRKTTNITVQDLCPADVNEHVFIPTDPVAIQLVLNALTRKGPADPAFRPSC